MTAAFSHDSDSLDDDVVVDQPAPGDVSDGDDAGSTSSWLDSLTDDDAEPEDSSSLALFEGDTAA